MKGSGLVRNRLCHSLRNCMIMGKDFFRAKHNQLRKVSETDSGRSLLFSTKFECINRKTFGKLWQRANARNVRFHGGNSIFINSFNNSKFLCCRPRLLFHSIVNYQKFLPPIVPLGKQML